MQDLIFLPARQSLFYFSSAGKFCLAHGLRQLTRDTKNDISCLLLYARKGLTTNGIRSWPSYNVIVNILFKASIFPIIGKKNNQSPMQTKKSQPSGQ